MNIIKLLLEKLSKMEMSDFESFLASSDYTILTRSDKSYKVKPPRQLQLGYTSVEEELRELLEFSGLKQFSLRKVGFNFIINFR